MTCFQRKIAVCANCCIDGFLEKEFNFFFYYVGDKSPHAPLFLNYII